MFEGLGKLIGERAGKDAAKEVFESEQFDKALRDAIRPLVKAALDQHRCAWCGLLRAGCSECRPNEEFCPADYQPQK